MLLFDNMLFIWNQSELQLSLASCSCSNVSLGLCDKTSCFRGNGRDCVSARMRINKYEDRNVLGVCDIASTLCPKSPSARGLVACLPVRLLFQSTKHNAFYPV